MVVILAIVALTVDVSYQYTERNRMAAAADAAAKSAAYEVWIGSGGNLQAFANREVQLHGFNPGGTTSVVVNNPPTQGAFAGNSRYVEVSVSQPTGTFFANILGWSTLTPGARAVAGTSAGPTCLIALAPVGSSPPAISIGNSTFTMNSCGIATAGDLEHAHTNSTITGSGGTTIGASTCIGGCAGFGTVVTNAPPPVDPLAATIAPIPALTCSGPAPSSGTIPSGVCYTSLDVVGSRTLAPGVTYFNGPVTFKNNAALSGSGVTLVLANGASLTANNHNSLTLTAPTSGLFPGIALYQPATNANPISFENNSTFNVTGAVYAPSADVSFRNGLSASSDCVLIVVRSMGVVNGNGALNNQCSAYGGSPLLAVSLAE